MHQIPRGAAHHQAPRRSPLLLRTFFLLALITAATLLSSAANLNRLLFRLPSASSSRTTELSQGYLKKYIIQAVNNRTNDECKIPCTGASLAGQSPTRLEREQCMYHFYHPGELDDRYTRHLLAHVPTHDLERGRILCLAGESGAGKTYLIHALSLLYSRDFYSDDDSTTDRKLYNKGDALLEFDCGEIEAKGDWNETVSQIVAHGKKDHPIPFIVFDNLQKCANRTVNELILPIFLASLREENPLFNNNNTSRAVPALPTAMKIFVTMGVDPRDYSTLDGTRDRALKALINKYGTEFRRHVYVYPVTSWSDDHYLFGVKKTIDSIPCDAGSKVRKISYKREVLEWLTDEMMYRPAVSELKHGRLLNDFANRDLELKLKVGEKIADFEKMKNAEMEAAYEDSNGPRWFSSMSSAVVSGINTVAESLSPNSRGYTVVIELKEGANDTNHSNKELHITVVEEGTSSDELDEAISDL